MVADRADRPVAVRVRLGRGLLGPVRDAVGDDDGQPQVAVELEAGLDPVLGIESQHQPGLVVLVREVAAEAQTQRAGVEEVAAVAREAVVRHAPEVGVGLDGHGEVGCVARPFRGSLSTSSDLLDLQQARRARLARRQAGGDPDAVAGLEPAELHDALARPPRSAPR